VSEGFVGFLERVEVAEARPSQRRSVRGSKRSRLLRAQQKKTRRTTRMMTPRLDPETTDLRFVTRVFNTLEHTLCWLLRRSVSFYDVQPLQVLPS
jgi:hypothetical protein